MSGTPNEVYYNRPAIMTTALNVEPYEDPIPGSFLLAAVSVGTGVALMTTRIPILGPILCTLGIWSFYKAIRLNEAGSDSGKGI